MIKSLASLRFVFAFLVFLGHVHILKDAIGHAFFYNLSGFILSYVYYDRVIAREISCSRFIKLRLTRLYPLYILTLFLAIPLTLHELKIDPLVWFAKLLSTVFMVQSYIPDNNWYFSFNGLAWSISDLFFFYLMFPFIVRFFDKIKNSFLILGFLGVAIGIYVLMHVVPESYQLFVFYINPFFRIFDFGLGVFMFKLLRRFKLGSFQPSFTFFEILAIAVLVLFYSQAHNFPEVFRYSIYYWPPMFLFIAVYALQKGYISKLLSYKPFLFLGDLSFGFYLYHQLVLRYVNRINNKLDLISEQWIINSIAFAIILVVCYFSYHLFEMPVKNKWRERLFTERISKS